MIKRILWVHFVLVAALATYAGLLAWAVFFVLWRALRANMVVRLPEALGRVLGQQLCCRRIP